MMILNVLTENILFFSILGSVFGLRVIQIKFRKNDVIFMIPYILLSVAHACAGVSPGSFINFVHGIIITDIFTDFTRINDNFHLGFLVFSSFLPLYTVFCAMNWNILYLDRVNAIMAILANLQGPILLDIFSHGSSRLLPYCPALLDILDGLEMTETQLDPRNVVWVQITICLTILLFHIPSLLEMYYLKCPERTNVLIVSERRFKLIQLASSVVFLVLRLVLFARNPHEFFLVMKTLIRVFTHYQMWSNLRRGQKIVSLEATEMSRETASRFANEKLSLALFSNQIRDLNDV